MANPVDLGRRGFLWGMLMSIANDALLVTLGQNQFPVYDGLGSLVTTQAGATRLTGAVNRAVGTAAGVIVANGAFVLPSMLSLEADSSMVFVINDTSQTIKVFPATGETNGGTLNASTSIPTGQSGIFIRVYGASVGKGGGQGTATNDWRSAVIP